MTLFPASDPLHASATKPAAPDVTSTVRYLASLKNISLTPEESAALARTTGENFSEWNRQLADGDTRRISALTIKAIDRTLDVVAALRVMRLVAQMIEGDLQPDYSELMKRATAMVDQFIGATSGEGMHRWPEPYETFRAHYGSQPWGPMHHRTADGTDTTTYLLNELIHRNPKEGPAFECRTTDWSCTKYMMHGKEHRDHRDGPAVVQEWKSGLWFKNEEYFTHGILHRPAAEGPAVIWADKAGSRVFEAYYEHGALHRDPADGPALRWTDANGTCVRELYAQHGIRHRDPKEGPAWYGLEDREEQVEYTANDKLHRDEADGPAIIHREVETGITSFEEYRHHGEIHRTCGPARIARDPVTGIIVHEEYYEKGMLHRLDGPARIERDRASGAVIWEEYQRNGILDRDEDAGPAYISRDPVTGAVLAECYYRNGQMHRTCGPASLARNETGRITVEFWYIDGKPHRDSKEGPAEYCLLATYHDTYQAITDASGETREELVASEAESTEASRTEYWFNGERHRDPEDGPAMIERDASGEIIDTQFWGNGEKIETPVPLLANRASRRKAKSGARKLSQRSKQVMTVGACDG